MHPEPIIEEEVRMYVTPPPLMGSLHVLPLLDDPMEGILGNLENPPQWFFKQKRRGRLPHESTGNVPNLTTEYAPFYQNAGSHPGANPWSAG